MLRPLLAFATLCLAAFLLAPTVASVHARVTELHVDRQTPWEIFRWVEEPTPQIPFPDCSKKERHLYSEITQWPARIQKDEAFNLRGVVQSEEDGREGVARIQVDVFLNETKSEPGIFLGEAESGPGGHFALLASVPFELKASHYHIVAHAKEKRIDCSTYFEHWSDPETDVVASTEIVFDKVPHPVAGREFELKARVLDVVGAPVANASVHVTLDGANTTVTTGPDGVFLLNHTPEEPGFVNYTAEYLGGAYYRASNATTSILVAKEAFLLDGADAGFRFVRSTPLTFTGHLYVAPSRALPEFTLDFEGPRVATCLTCPVTDSVNVSVAPDGAFSVELVVPPSEGPGAGTLTARGGGLTESYTSNFTVSVPTTLTLEARGSGLFSKGYEATALLVDEAGRPVVGQVAFAGPAGLATGTTGSTGRAQFAGSGACGSYTSEATFAGGDMLEPSRAQHDLLVCGWLAFVPPWLLAIPWYVWPLALLALLSAWFLVRGLRQTYAPSLHAGPPLTLLFTEPADEAAGYAAVGETIGATALLDAPLPEGHTLRMGTSRATDEQPIGDDHRATLRFTPDKLGDIAVRAEIVDPKGRVISRRTLHVHVIRYAHEIERRYLELRGSAGATDSVTPREFEQWLRERAPDLAPTVAQHLIHIFEEADYSPRTAGRADFAAFLAAERLHAQAHTERMVSARAESA